jgi:hypothetical protein
MESVQEESIKKSSFLKEHGKKLKIPCADAPTGWRTQFAE